MDLELAPDQLLIRDAARAFLAGECGGARVRAMEAESQGYSGAFWRAMAELGWCALALPEAYGGAGGSFLDLCVLIEEHGRFRLPGPFIPTVVLCALPIAAYGSAAQRAEFLPGIAAGERVLTYAEAEANAEWGAAGIALAASVQGADYVLHGEKLFVPYAAAAQTLLVAARSSGGRGEKGVTLLLADAASPGITLQSLRTAGPDPQYAVRFEGVRVPKARVLGKAGQGWSIVAAIRRWGAAAKCAELVGGAGRVLEMTVDHAKTREQFGRPIGSFQAVQHHCANMAVDALAARFIAYEAIWRLSEGLDAAAEVSMAKAWVGDACRRVCALGHQVHGAIGFTREHDLQLYTRATEACAAVFGDADCHRQRTAERLGL